MRSSADNAGSDVPYQNVVITDATRNKVMDLFDAYVDLPGVTEELHELINDLPKELAKKDSSSGNIIITGNNMSDKTAFAKLIARAIDMIDPITRRKVVKTTGDTLTSTVLPAVQISSEARFSLLKILQVISSCSCRRVTSELKAGYRQIIICYP